MEMEGLRPAAAGINVPLHGPPNTGQRLRAPALGSSTFPTSNMATSALPLALPSRRVD